MPKSWRTSKVVVFGVQDLAQLAKYYLDTDSTHDVVAFTVNQQYLPEEQKLIEGQLEDILKAWYGSESVSKKEFKKAISSAVLFIKTNHILKNPVSKAKNEHLKALMLKVINQAAAHGLH